MDVPLGTIHLTIRGGGGLWFFSESKCFFFRFAAKQNFFFTTSCRNIIFFMQKQSFLEQKSQTENFFPSNFQTEIFFSQKTIVPPKFKWMFPYGKTQHQQEHKQ